MNDSIGKNTKQREILTNILIEKSSPLSVEDISKIMKKKINKNIALSTIYRNIILMIEKGQVIKTFSIDGTAMYMMNKHTHTHKLECQKCHKTINLEVCPYQLFQESILKEKDFVLLDSNIPFKGYCKKCQ